MSYLTPSTSTLQSTESIHQDATSRESQQRGPHSTSIHILDDDSLLNIFYLCRPFLLGEDEEDENRFAGGLRGWAGEHWWFKLTHVCRRWRNLILASASYLGLCLACTPGTPVADMLAHSPPLPLVIDFFQLKFDITAEDKEGIFLALEQRDRIRRIRLEIPSSNLERLIVSIDGEYPILEYLTMAPLSISPGANLKFPETLRAPRLRHLALFGFNIPRGSRVFTTAVGLDALRLSMAGLSTYFDPTVLLEWITFMSKLKTLVVLFPTYYHEEERLLSHMPNLGRVTLPNLRHFRFRGVCSYVEEFVRRISAPRLEKLQIFFNHRTFSIPHLVEFIDMSENLRFNDGKLLFFDNHVHVRVYPREEADDETEMYALHIRVYNSWPLYCQVSSMSQILNALGQRFSAVEHLTLVNKTGTSRSPREYDDVDRTEWHKLLKPFINVKTLCIDDELIKGLPRCFQLEDGEDPLELLPQLEELTYSGSGDTDDAFISFINARQNAGRPVTLVPVSS